MLLRWSMRASLNLAKTSVSGSLSHSSPTRMSTSQAPKSESCYLDRQLTWHRLTASKYDPPYDTGTNTCWAVSAVYVPTIQYHEEPECAIILECTVRIIILVINGSVTLASHRLSCSSSFSNDACVLASIILYDWWQVPEESHRSNNYRQTGIRSFSRHFLRHPHVLYGYR